MARPPAYSRDYSFSNYETNNPGQPKPGAQLDAEFDDVSVAVTGTQSALALIQRDDGALANQSVGEDQFVAGLFDHIADDAIASAAVEADRAESAAGQSANSASSAASQATVAGTAATNAQGAAAVAAQAATAAVDARTHAQDSAGQAQSWANDASLSASLAEDFVSGIESSVDQSYKWAEYLAGPVAPAPAVGPGGTPYPEAVDDGMYSSKWWAIKAKSIVGAFGVLYLGPSGTPPLMGNEGAPLSPGMIYYQVPPGEMMVWDGARWEPISKPTPAVTSTYTYLAAAGQTVFSGFDQFGETMIFSLDFPEPVDVHVNGVRLVNSRGGAWGDYTVNYAANNIALSNALVMPANSVVQIDLLMPREQLAPTRSTVEILKVLNLGPSFDGSTVSFPLQNSADAAPLNPAQVQELMISLDGIPQEAAIDFTVMADTITFTTAPPAGSRFWGLWFKPGIVV